MAGEMILIVDDNLLNLKLARIQVSAAGYQVVTAIDADEALRQIDAAAPRLILMDLQLPGMDGLELTRHLKADPATCHIPIIALTAHAMRGAAELAYAAGCDGYASKPIDAAALCATIEGMLAASRRA
jgi:CheY-like chemotaxis protein